MGKPTFNPATGKLGASGRLIKTQIHRDYQSTCERWALQNREAVRRAASELRDIKVRYDADSLPFALKIDCYFVFKRERIFTVNQKCLQIDANNRLKPLLDALVNVLGIDDKHYFAGNCEKVTALPTQAEGTFVRIGLMAPRTYAEIQDLMRKECERAR